MWIDESVEAEFYLLLLMAATIPRLGQRPRIISFILLSISKVVISEI